MDATNVLFIVIFAVLIYSFIQNCHETFYIEPNTIVGGEMVTTGGEYHQYNAPLELEGPGDAAWSGY